MSAFNEFAQMYDTSVNEVIDNNRLSHNTAIKFRDAFVKYGRALQLDGAVLNHAEAAMGAWIDLNLPD